MVSAVLSNLLLNKSDHQSLIEVDSRVLFLAPLILGISIQSKILGSSSEFEISAHFSVALDFFLD